MKLHFENLPKTVALQRCGSALYLEYIDQRLLPGKLTIIRTSDWAQVTDAIKHLGIRGAPAIGLAGAAALALWCDTSWQPAAVEDVARIIAKVRPTAVNLSWAVERALKHLHGLGNLALLSKDEVDNALFELVKTMQAEDEAANRAIGGKGATLLKHNSSVLTHCNAGSLATYYYGTALGVVYAAAEQGKIKRVYADETRPVGQGARLTVWELSRVGIPTTLICDNMAASLMAAGKVDAVIVGADRIARNGDTANKIGTYGVAVLAREHGIPFYVAAPSSTLDLTLADGSGIVIEQRSENEVLTAPIEGVDVYNPGFDVTPARYISKIITQDGSFDPCDIEKQYVAHSEELAPLRSV